MDEANVVGVISTERITEMQVCDPAKCPMHHDILDRIGRVEDDSNNKISKLEGEISDIHQELKEHAESTTYVRVNIDTVLAQQTQMSTDIKELRIDMMGLVTRTLEKSQNDMTAWIKMTEKHRQEQDERDRSVQAKSEEQDKAFYRKLITVCVAVLGTIVLSFFGIKALIPLFG